MNVRHAALVALAGTVLLATPVMGQDALKDACWEAAPGWHTYEACLEAGGTSNIPPAEVGEVIWDGRNDWVEPTPGNILVLVAFTGPTAPDMSPVFFASSVGEIQWFGAEGYITVEVPADTLALDLIYEYGNNVTSYHIEQE